MVVFTAIFALASCATVSVSLDAAGSSDAPQFPDSSLPGMYESTVLVPANATASRQRAIYTVAALTDDLLSFRQNNLSDAIAFFKPILERTDFDPEWTGIRLNDPAPGMNYSRTLIFHSPEVEALILAWPPGAASPIHDHPEGGCVLKVLRGALKQFVYTKRPRDGGLAHDEGGNPAERPMYSYSHLVPAGTVSTLAGRTGIHHIEGASTETTYSLHIYSPADFYNLKAEGPHRTVWPVQQ